MWKRKFKKKPPSCWHMKKKMKRTNIWYVRDEPKSNHVTFRDEFKNFEKTQNLNPNLLEERNTSIYLQYLLCP